MARTWSYTTTYSTNYYHTGYFQTEEENVTIPVTASTFQVYTPRIKGAVNVVDPTWSYGSTRLIALGITPSWGSISVVRYTPDSSSGIAMNSYSEWLRYTYPSSFQTSDYFDSTNKTVKTVSFGSWLGGEVRLKYNGSGTNNTLYVDAYNGASYTNKFTFSTITLELNVPPTFNTTPLSLDTTSAYANVTTASVTVSDTTAYYGGEISSATLTIGNQTASISGDGTISIALDTAGTFTPVVSVTDSRGQVATQSLAPLTVNSYSSPTVNFTADRTTSTGTPDDEGTYATLDATFVFSDVIASLIAPSVVLTDENGTQTTPTVTWYSSRAADGTLSGSVTWANLSTGDTVYGLVPGLNTNYSYQVSVRPRDNRTTGTAIIQTVSSAFYTIDFLAGGHGIAFGQPASTTGFVCNMTTTFNDTVAFGDDADFGADIFIELPDYQVSSTTDKAIYDAIVALGWDSDVLS